MTELKALIEKEGLETVKKKVEGMDGTRLLAELDDTIQFDLMKSDNVEWAKKAYSQKEPYRILIAEIRKRLNEQEASAEK